MRSSPTIYFLIWFSTFVCKSHQKNLRESSETESNSRALNINSSQKVSLTATTSQVLVGGIHVKNLREQRRVENSSMKKNANQMHRATGEIQVEVIEDSFVKSQSLDSCNIFQKKRFINQISMGAHDFLKVGQVVFAERFDGQRQEDVKGVIGMSDVLTGTPTDPLDLIAAYNQRENLYAEKYCVTEEKNKCGFELKGRGPYGYKGPGAISALFKNDKASVRLSFKSSGASLATLTFFRRNGTYIDSLDVDIEKATDYDFYHSKGEIAGFSVYPVGDALSWHKFSLTGLCYNQGTW